MKKVQVKTKHSGNIMVPVFETYEDAVKEYGKKEVLSKVNRMVRVDLVNKANVTKSPDSKRRAKLKELEAKAKAGTLTKVEKKVYDLLLEVL